MNVRHPTSGLLKCDLFQTLSTFQNPFLRIFAAGKAALVCFEALYVQQAAPFIEQHTHTLPPGKRQRKFEF